MYTCTPLYIYIHTLVGFFFYENMSLGHEGDLLLEHLALPIRDFFERDILLLVFLPELLPLRLPCPYFFFLFFFFLLRFFLFFPFFLPFPLRRRRRSLLIPNLFFLLSIEATLLFEELPLTILLPTSFNDCLPLVFKEDLNDLPAMTSDRTFFPSSFADGRKNSLIKGKAFLPIWPRIDISPWPRVFGLCRLKILISPCPWPLIIGVKDLLMVLNSCSLRVLNPTKTILTKKKHTHTIYEWSL